MLSYNSFIYNYPPPPVPSREMIINEGLKLLEQSEIDQNWVKNWIERRQNNLKQIKLSEYRQKLVEHAQILQRYEQELTNSSPNSNILFQYRTQIERSNEFIYNELVVKHIEKLIHRRKSKRARIRRKKQNKHIESRRNINEEKCLNEKIHDIKLILYQVKQLKHTYQQETNYDVLNELIDIEQLCHEKLCEYRNQTNSTCYMFDSDLYNYLFNNHNQSFYQSINLDGQNFLRAHQNKTNLIDIRQAWDQYANSSTSSLDNFIPSKWYEPQLPSDDDWSKFIFNKTR